MKKSIVSLLVFVIAALSLSSVSAAPRERYYDQMGNKYWCYVDSDGCWITGEEGEKNYIMFWSEASREKFMGPDSNAPIGVMYDAPEMPLKPPQPPGTNCYVDKYGHCPLFKSVCERMMNGRVHECTLWDDCLCDCFCNGQWSALKW